MPNEEFIRNDFETVIRWMLPAFPLVKNSYSIPAITVACISVIANSIKRQGNVKWDEPLDAKMKKWNLIQGAETFDDMRLNLLIVGDAGSGKSGLMKGIANLNPFSVSHSQSRPHYDQLIGSTERWMENKKWVYSTMPGELAKDIVLLDEVLSVYTEDYGTDNRRIREILRASLSRIGTNPVQKPMVRIPEEHQIRFYPECTIIQGFPTDKVPVSLISQGDIRRCQIVNITFPLEAKEKTRRFGMKPNETKSDFKKAKDYLAYLRTRKFNPIITPEVMEYIKKLMEELKEYTRGYGLKAMWYYKISYFDLESQLIRYAIEMSVVRDNSSDDIHVTLEDVKKGWKYYFGVYADALVWLNTNTYGSWGTEGVKGGDHDKLMSALLWLHDKKATNSKSNVTVNELQEFMVEKRFYTNVAGTRRFYNTLLNHGYIKNARRGKVWVVWLDAKGKELLIETIENEGD